MQLQRLGAVGHERPTVRRDGVTYDLSPLTADIDGAFLGDDGLARTAQALDAGALTALDGADDLRVGAPVARPGAVVCIGQNYAAHAAESGSPPPQRPIIFFKHPNTIVGPFDDVVKPVAATKLDWEVELAIVIGRRAHRLDSPATALDHVAGYTIANDVSERVWQNDESGGQWSKGKTAPTFLPLGPALVTADEIADPQQLGLRSWVNDEPRQDSSTADMIFGVAVLVHHLSQYLALDPGDVVSTGTPQGVALGGKFPFLEVGDEYRATIDGLGEMHQRVVAEL